MLHSQHSRPLPELFALLLFADPWRELAEVDQEHAVLCLRLFGGPFVVLVAAHSRFFLH
jgi:hypothetical protein